MSDLINRDEVLKIVSTDEPQLLDSDALYMEFSNLNSVEAIPVSCICRLLTKVHGYKHAVLLELLEWWFNNGEYGEENEESND